MKISAESDFQSETWTLIFKGLLFNAVASLLLIGALSLLGKFNGITQLNALGLPSVAYFNKLSLANFWVFFTKHCAMGPVAEEMFYRLPVFLLIAWEFKWFFKDVNLAKYALWLALIIPTAFWAFSHQPGTIILPVFITGLTYGWLIIKTRPSWPWPAVVCHSLSNLSLYILVKILQMLGYAPIN